MLRFFFRAVPLVVLLSFLFSLVISFFDVGPAGALQVSGPAPFGIVFATWLLEAFGLVALYLFVQGHSGAWWFDGLMTGWLAWIFRGPLLVITIVVAAGQAQAPWFRLTVGWWVLYSVAGLALAVLWRRQMADVPKKDEEEPEPEEPEPEELEPEEPEKRTEEPPEER